MSAVTESQVLDALRVVEDPDLHRDIVTLGFVKDVRICDGAVAFRIELTTPACPVRETLAAQARGAVSALPGVTTVEVDMTAKVRGRDTEPQELVPGVRNLIAIASGKGGVGKSTVAVNLAAALAATGARVGLLDADIYGPSLPLMMGASERPLMHDTDTGPKIVPVSAHGVLMMSLGFLLEENKAVAWRGPMVASAVRQLLGDVTWGEQDYLIVDLPPGTGDAPMTLAQQAPLTGIVIVMTPQRVALQIANKSILMFRMLERSTGRTMPILGIIENMSGDVFGTGGGEQMAAELDVPFLGRVPLDGAVRESGDAGMPVVRASPDSAAAAAFQDIASGLAARVSILRFHQEETASD